MKKVVFILTSIIFLSCVKEEFPEPEILDNNSRDSSLVSINYKGETLELYDYSDYSYYANDIEGDFKTGKESYYYNDYSYNYNFDNYNNNFRKVGNNIEIYVTQNYIGSNLIDSEVYSDLVKIVLPFSEVKIGEQIFLSKTTYNKNSTKYAEFIYNYISRDYYGNDNLLRKSLISTIGRIKINEVEYDNIKGYLEVYYDNEYHVYGSFSAQLLY